MRSHHLWIVRRGNVDRFQTHNAAFAGEPFVDVIWDRRVRERRQQTTAVAPTTGAWALTGGRRPPDQLGDARPARGPRRGGMRRPAFVHGGHNSILAPTSGMAQVVYRGRVRRTWQTAYPSVESMVGSTLS